MPLKNGCRSLPSADFARYSTSVSSDGSIRLIQGCEAQPGHADGVSKSGFVIRGAALSIPS
jgi:hypothetical protein